MSKEYVPAAVEASAASPERPRPTKIERLFLLIIPVFAYLFVRWLFYFGDGPRGVGLGVTVLGTLFCVIAGIWLGKTGGFNRVSFSWLLLTFLLGLPFFLYVTNEWFIFGILGMIFAGAMAVHSGGEGYRSFTRDAFAAEAGNAVFARPFSRFGSYFGILGAMFHVKQKTEKRRLLPWILLGVVITIPLTMLVCSLLIDADDAFRAMMGQVKDWVDLHILRQIAPFFLRMLFVVPLALYLFGMFYASRHPRRPEKTADERAARWISCRRLPQALTCTVLTPPVLLYLLYLYSQRAYYFSALAGKLPEAYKVADYAREGFFEVCVVAGINALLLFLMERFCRRTEEGKRTVGHKLFGIALPVLSLLMIISAGCKLWLYIASFGLTRLRLGAAWVMAVLAVVFVLSLIALFVPKLKLARVLMGVLTAAICLALLVNSDGVIAACNVDAYLSGRVAEIDLAYLSNGLSDAAIPAIERLSAEAPDGKIKDRAAAAVEVYLRNIRGERYVAWDGQPEEYEDFGYPWYVWNLQDLVYRARK